MERKKQKNRISAYIDDDALETLETFCDQHSCSISKAIELIIKRYQSGSLREIPKSDVPELEALIEDKLKELEQKLNTLSGEDDALTEERVNYLIDEKLVKEEQDSQKLIQEKIAGIAKSNLSTINNRLEAIDDKLQHLSVEDFRELAQILANRRIKQQHPPNKSHENALQQTKEAGNISKDGSADQVAVPVHTYDAALQVIKQLSTQGESQKQIAEHLNQQGYATKTGAGQWDQPRVSRAAYD